MNKFREVWLTICVLCVSLHTSIVAQSDDMFSRLRGFKLLESDRNEIASSIGFASKKFGPDGLQYELPEGRIWFEFSPGRCGKENNDGWDVPKGVLTRIFFEPSKNVTPESLKIDLKDFRKIEVSDAPGQYSYENPKTGIDVGVLETGFISIIEFYPNSDLDEKFSCTQDRR